MKRQIQNRILAFFLAMVMLCTSAPFPAISVEPEEPVQNVEQEGTATSVYSKYVGSLAEISFDFYSYLVISDDPSIDVQDGQELVATDMTDMLVLEIVDCYWDAESYALWYKVAAAPGCVLPEKLQQNPWVFQNYTDVYEDEEWESYSPDSLTIHENMQIPSVSGKLDISISSFDLPAAAEVVVNDLTETVAPGDGIGIVDIKVDNNGVFWQPAVGETVRVALPVPSGAEVVNVYHYLENAETIAYALERNLVEVLDLANASLTDRNILADAIKAYQDATDSAEMKVAVEVYKNIKVTGKTVQLDTLGFSIYVVGESAPYAQIAEDWEALGADTVYYVKANETITFTNSYDDNWSAKWSSNGARVARDYKAPTWTDWTGHDNIVITPPTVVGQRFTVTSAGKTITFEVIAADAGVETPDKETVYIALYVSDGFPSEPIVDSSGVYYRYTSQGSINKGNYGSYSSNSNGIIKKELFNNSSLKLEGNNVTAIVDNSGVNTLAFINMSEELKYDIVSKYVSAANLEGTANDYELLVYVVKYEDAWTSRGWYINCKVVRKGNVSLVYDYNVPNGFQEMNVTGSFPTNLSVQKDTEVTIAGKDGISVKADLADGTQTATLLGWSTDPNATEAQYTGGEKLTLSEDTTLYAIWSLGDFTYSHFDIEVHKTVMNADYTAVDNDVEEFTFAINGLNGSYSYTIYNGTGAQMSTGTISAANNSFNLKNGWYIRILDVMVGSYQIVETEKNGYTVYGGSYTMEITSDVAEKTGEFIANYYNIKKAMYTVIYFDGTSPTLQVNPNPEQYEENASVILPTISKVGYTFLGWKCTVAGCTTCQTGYHTSAYTMPATNVDMYAQWQTISYTIYYNTDGGSTVNQQNYTIETDVSLAPEPTKVGYTFAGWNLATGVNTWAEKTYSAGEHVGTGKYGDITLVAQWIPNSYTVTFKDYDGDVLKTETVSHGGSATAPADPTREGYTFTGWDVAFDNVTSDLTVTAQYEINQYTVKFVDWDGTELKTETVSHGGSATAPADPTREGYTFTGWDVAFDNVTSNLTVTAQYEIKTYTVTFVDWDGTELKTETVNHGSSATAPADPTREGYTFAGWDKGYSNITSNLTVTAQYAVNTYTITWIVDGNETTETYEYGAAITPPADPEKKGHTFAGWSPAVPATMPAEDLELVAQWTVNQYQVVIQCNKPGAVVVSGAGTYAYGTFAPICIKPVDGYRIKSITRNGVVWGTANQDGTPNKESVKENLTIVITVEAIPYTITYDLDGGTVAGSNPESYTVESGEITLINPTRTGYTFAGWTGTGLADATMTVTIPAGSIGNRVYTATWTINSYTVTWIVDGNTTTETYEYGATPTFKGSTDKAADAQYTYTFAGWTPAIDTVTGEATYTATYTQTKRAYTVTYERGFGLGSTTQEYLWGTTVTIDVVDPAYTGFAFMGWQCDIAGCACAEGVYHQFGYAFTMPAADVVLTAKWDPKPYTLTYNGGGVTETQEFYAAGKTVVVAAAPIRDGYKFTGWKDEITGTVYQPGDEFTMPEENVTLTAQWTVKTYTITFVDWNGNVLQTAQVQYGIMPAAPANPSRPRTMDYSYEFTGWSPAVVNVTGDQTYTATYKARQHYVYIGINYSYHMSTYQYTYPSDGHSKQNAYHQFPNEPRELWMEAMRAAYQPDGSWSLYPADNSGQLTGLPSDFINETLLKQHAVTTNSAYGVFDSTGDLVKACFQFSADDTTNTQMYEALIKAWLKQGILGGTDIYWDKVPPENCKVIPYVVKQQGSGNWYVDIVIVVDETSLTIEAPKVEGSDGQIFLFEITATDHPGFGFVVAVSEGKSVVINGLFPGKEYIVKELTGWSWRSTKTPTWAYTTDENPNYSGILPNLDTSGEGDTATFTLGTTSNKLVVSNTWADTDWLGDEAYLDNKFPPYVEITP